MPTTGTNAFSILYETHGLFFGMMLLHVSLAQMERVEAYLRRRRE